MWNYLHKSLTLKLDSGDEDSGNEALKNYRKDKLTGNSNNFIDKGKMPEQVMSNPVSSASLHGKMTREQLIDYTVTVSLGAFEIGEDTKSYSQNLFALRDGLKKFNSLEFEKLNIKNPTDVNKFFITLLKEHGTMYSKCQTTRLS